MDSPVENMIPDVTLYTMSSDVSALQKQNKKAKINNKQTKKNKQIQNKTKQTNKESNRHLNLIRL